MKEILSAGEKIRKLRTAIGLSQEELTENVVSKSLISMIEQGKRSLTLQTAEIIAQCLNRYYHKMGQDITAEYLMETEEDSIREEIAKDLDHLRRAINSRRADETLVQNTFEKVMNLTQKWKLEEEYAELKILRGNFYYDNYQYQYALKDYLDVMDHSTKVREYGQIARVYNLLGSTYQMQMLLENAIAHYQKGFDTAMFYSTDNQDKIKAQTMFNQIVCYKRLKRYDVALTHIDLFRNLKWDDPEFKIYIKQITLIEANIYRDIENWRKAEETYKSLLDEAKRLDAETLYLLYENYGLLHRNQGHKTKALKYFEKAFKLKDEVSLNYLPELYLYQSTCYNIEEEYEEMATLLEQGLKLADMISVKHMMIKVRLAYVEVFIKLKDYNSALQQLNSVEKLVFRGVAKPLLYDLYSYYIEVYNGLGSYTEATEYAVKIRQIKHLSY
ncbi:helix-turn-helix domain-containing protein [Alkaliphilus hydrothermalis]|uniref:Tetratricopeptide (TPR) repeat protein n=1 Tax=Alkaliphilus hydrothermalis TaxID=1482730 RepID=A0ABS2NPT6_9FIRM|nr:helix-turn-helix domain-containing protein [Alkaliphilus hydrothermalis]MBM7614954.1 tetratricopeptide (TPR) repeat protein [Alkaliphilus hydrothermalis]